MTGAPDWGESDEAAAAREVREETGLDVTVAPLDFRYELRRKDGWEGELWDRLYEPGTKTVPEECYAAEVPPDAEPTLTPIEHDAYRWCTFQEAEGLLRWEDNRRALEVLRDRLTR